jgi:hypothetical protein
MAKHKLKWTLPETFQLKKTDGSISKKVTKKEAAFTQ